MLPVQVKALGNARFKAADYRRAMRRYKRALEVLEYDQKRDFVDWEEEQRATQAKERVLVLNNMAAVLLKESFLTPARAASSSTTRVPIVLISVHSTGFFIDSGTMIMAPR